MLQRCHIWRLSPSFVVTARWRSFLDVCSCRSVNRIPDPKGSGNELPVREHLTRSWTSLSEGKSSNRMPKILQHSPSLQSEILHNLVHVNHELKYRGADKSLARPTSRCILFDGDNIPFDASLVIYINSTNIHPIMIINRIHETQNLLSL